MSVSIELDIAAAEAIGAHLNEFGFITKIYTASPWPLSDLRNPTVYMHITTDDSWLKCVTISFALPHVVVMPIRIGDEIKDRKPLVVDLNDPQAMESIEERVFEWLA